MRPCIMPSWNRSHRLPSRKQKKKKKKKKTKRTFPSSRSQRHQPAQKQPPPTLSFPAPFLPPSSSKNLVRRHHVTQRQTAIWSLSQTSTRILHHRTPCRCDAKNAAR